MTSLQKFLVSEICTGHQAPTWGDLLTGEHAWVLARSEQTDMLAGEIVTALKRRGEVFSKDRSVRMAPLSVKRSPKNEKWEVPDLVWSDEIGSPSDQATGPPA